MKNYEDMYMAMRSTVARGALVSAVAATILLSSTTVASAATGVIEDDNLAACINETLGRGAATEITNADLGGLTDNLWCQEKGIATLEGLQGAVNLKRLNLGSNNLTEVSQLSGLTQLWRLDLNNNQITDLEPLRPLTQMQRLRVDYNSEALSSLEPLSGMNQLLDLAVNLSAVSDLSPLSGLTTLTDLTVNNSEVSDLRPLASLTALTEVSLSGNQIVDVTPLAALPALEEVRLASNNIGDLSAFGSVPRTNYVVGQMRVPSDDVRYIPAGASSYSTVLSWEPKNWTGASVNLGNAVLTDTGEAFAGVQRSYTSFSSTIQVPFVDPAVGSNYSGYVEVPVVYSSITSGAPAPAESESAYSFQFAATNGFPAESWDVTGVLPAGIELSAAGLLAGTPEAAGVFDFTVSVTDTWGNVIQQEVTLEVADSAVTGDIAPTISAPASQSVGVGKSATFTVSASGTPTPNVSWERSTDNGATWTPVASGVRTEGDLSILTVLAESTAQHGDQFRATARNTAGEALSPVATLGVTKSSVVDPETGGTEKQTSTKPVSQVSVRLVETGAPSGVLLASVGTGALLLGGAAIAAHLLARRRVTE